MIKDNVYIGSSVCFASGAQVSSTNLKGLGSFVSGIFDEQETIIACNPATVVKKNINLKENWQYKYE